MWQQFIHEKPFFDKQIDILGCKKLLVCRKIHRSTKKVSFSALLLQNWYLTKKILSAWSHKNKLFLDESYRFWSSDTIVLWRSLSLLFWALNVFSSAKATKSVKHRDCKLAAASLQDDQNKPLIEWVSSVKWLKSHADLCYK